MLGRVKKQYRIHKEEKRDSTTNRLVAILTGGIYGMSGFIWYETEFTGRDQVLS